MFISEAVIAVIIDWIDNNLHKPLRIEQIARYSGYSKWYLQRLFLQYRGESLGRYIRNKKLDSAARDLRETGNDSNLLIVFYVQIMPDDFVMQLHRF
ncbi:transcriptional activator RamA [Klebsiella michiganensis]|nr:transcriptional activator RamA [Klebsiella michiganensis]